MNYKNQKIPLITEKRMTVLLRNRINLEKEVEKKEEEEEEEEEGESKKETPDFPKYFKLAIKSM